MDWSELTLRLRGEAAGRDIAAAYYRVSADPSQGGRSVGSQRHAARGEAKRRGWYLPEDLEFDETKSASIFGLRRGVERPDWANYLEVVRMGVVRVAILPDVYRGMREFIAYQDLLEACRLRNVTLNAEGRDYDLSTETDAFIVGLEVLKGAGEALRISSRVNRGVAGSVAQGRPPVGKVPFGYYRPPRRIGEKVFQVPDRRNARLVKAGARYFLLTKNASRIARRWSEVTGKKWHQHMVRDVLLNPALIGRRTVSELQVQPDGSRVRVAHTIAGDWEPILDVTVYYDLQQAFDDPRRKLSNGPTPSQLCTSVARCGGSCGKPLRHQRTKHLKDRPVYSCARGCVSCEIGVLDEPVEDAVKAVLAATIRDEIVGALREDLPAAEDDTHGRSIEAAKAALVVAQREKEEFSAAAASSGLKPGDVVKAMVGYSAAVEAAEADLKSLVGAKQVERPSAFLTDVREYVDRVYEVLEVVDGGHGEEALRVGVTSMLSDELAAVAAEAWRSADLECRRGWVREELDVRLTPLKTGQRFAITPARGWDWVGEFRPMWSYDGLR